MDALSAPLVFFWMNLFRPKEPVLTGAQRAMLQMLQVMSNDEWNGVIMIKDRSWKHNNLMEVCMEVAPGGFLLIAGDYYFLKPYFIGHGWEVMPFMFGDKFIFRKPICRSA